MSASSSSSAQAALRLLADRLGELLRGAGLEGQQLAELCGWSPSKVSRIRTARVTPSEEDIRDWAVNCGAPEQIPDLLASLHAVQGMWLEWRRLMPGGIRPVQARISARWETATHIRQYSGWLIPGLLQDREYARNVFRIFQQRGGFIDDVDAATEERVGRRLLQDSNRQFDFVLEEFLFHANIASAEVMQAQLGHLLTVATMGNVTLGIIPMGCRRAMWPAEGFMLLDDALVDVELTTGQLNITQPREIAIYQQTFTDLAEMAVFGAQARRLIATAVSALS